MDIDLDGKVKPSFPETQFDWYVRNGIERFLKLIGKRPAEKERRKCTKKYRSIAEHVRSGFNIGVLIPNGVVVLDIDKRDGKDGFAALGRLLTEAYKDEPETPTLDDLIKSTFTVKTGGGGYHLYFSHDPGETPRGSVKGYDGVDLKTSANQYVVAPGSVHPDTGLVYTIENLPDRLAKLPEPLRPFILTKVSSPFEKPAPGSITHPSWGVASADQLEALLAPLDPKDYRAYVGDDKAWINLMSAAHHATGGDPEAMRVFANWSSQDPKYASEAHKATEKHWPSFRERRTGSHVATIDSILGALAASNREAARLGEYGKRNAKADAVARDLRHKLQASALDVLDGGEVANLRAYVATLSEDWYHQDPALLHELADKISEMPDDHWTELSGVLSKSMDGEQSPLQIERLIKKKATKRKKEEARAKLTQAEIVDTAARRALKATVADSRDLLRPPRASFYIYRGGYWQRFYEEVISDNCFHELDAFLDKSTSGLKPLPYYTREALNQISYMVGTESTVLYNRKELPSCVNLINGTLWFNKDGTYELKPHKREDFLTTRLPYSYDPEAECPSMQEMLTQVFDHVRRDYGEAEMLELIRHFWEFVGYTLDPKKDIAVMMFFLGEGHNGKSRIASIISNLFDSGALLSTDLIQQLDPSNKHGAASLEGKLLAMDDDVGESAEISDRVFKKICQSKLYNINPKNKDDRQIMLQTIVLFIANNSVKIIDTSPGFSRRVYAIDFSTDISHLQSSPLPDLVELLEMPGVLNEAIKGLARLRKRGFFDVPKCAQDCKTKFLVDSNSVLSYWDSIYKTESDSSSIKIEDLYRSYAQYMLDGGFGKAINRKAFAKALKRQKLTIVNEKVMGWKIVLTV